MPIENAVFGLTLDILWLADRLHDPQRILLGLKDRHISFT